MRSLKESVLHTLPHMMGGHFSLSNECRNSPFWDEWYPRLRFAFFVLYMFYYAICIPILFWWTRRRRESSKKILPGCAYASAVGFMALYTLLAVIAEGLFNCQQVGSLKYLKVWVAANVFGCFADIIILYIILFPYVNRMMKHANWVGHPLIGHWILMVFVSIFMLLFLIMWNYNLIREANRQHTTDPNYGIEATYVTLYLAAALYTAGHLVSSRIQSIRIHSSQQGLLPWCPLIVIGLVGYALVEFIIIFAFYIVPRIYTESASATLVVLGLFFQGLMYLSLPLLASSKALEDDEAEGTRALREQKDLHT